MDNELKEKVQILEKKIDAIYKSVETTRRYFKTLLYLSLIVIVLPVLIFAIIVPKVINTYLSITTSF